VRSAILITRLLASFAARCLASALMVVAAAMILCTCSPGADYPTPFPAVNNMPPPRSDTPLDANQIQQATEDLISARDRLSTEAQGSQNKSASKPPAKTAAKTSAKPAPSAAAKNQPASLTPASARQPLKSDTGEAADAETK
jgi:hypothetical protein